MGEWEMDRDRREGLLRLAIRVTPPHPKNRKHGMRIPPS
jgi:hypothetical protein